MEFSFPAACRCVKLLLYWFLLIWQINFSLSNAFLYILSSKSAYIGNIVSYFYATFFCFWLMVGLAELCLLSSLSCIMPMHNDFTICLSDEPLVSLLSQRFFYQLYTLVPRSCTYRCSHMWLRVIVFMSVCFCAHVGTSPLPVFTCKCTVSQKNISNTFNNVSWRRIMWF